MIFSELYSIYYLTVAKILEVALSHKTITDKEIHQCIVDNAFLDSTLTIEKALKTRKWPLLNKDGATRLKHKPISPLTMIEKQWLKAIMDDPRIKLFGLDVEGLEDIEPLFSKDDYKIFDQCSDGDPFEDQKYIANFRFILHAIEEKKAIKISIVNRSFKKVWFSFYPIGFEYSIKDDKIRVLTDCCRFSQFNLAKIIDCGFCDELIDVKECIDKKPNKELVLHIYNERNTLERAMLHFAHFKKAAEKINDNEYILRLYYDENDEIEVVIRIISFGPNIKVVEPQRVVELIKKRLQTQQKLFQDKK